MQTPAFERIETLSGKYGDEGEKLIFKILKRGEKAASGEADLALRYDLTVPAMRVYAHRRNELPTLFKRSQIGPVWRADRPGRGRFREFYQCDVDIIGSASRLADVAVIQALADALDAVGLDDFHIRLNSRHVLKGMMDCYGVPEPAQAAAITVLDKIDKIGVEGITEEMAALTADGVSLFAPLLADLAADDFEQRLRGRLVESDVGQMGLSESDEIVARLTDLMPPGRIAFDPILARGLDYYTGPIFEFVAHGGAGSIAGGGRYDNLAGLFLKTSVPVCGGSLGIERILLLLKARQSSAQLADGPVYVTVWDETLASASLALAAELRAAGMAAEISVVDGKLGKQLRTADNRACRVAVVLGPDEHDAGTVVVKNMVAGSQETVARAALIDAVKRALNAAESR